MAKTDDSADQARLAREYGLSIVEFAEMRQSQDDRCALCNRAFGSTIPHVDHCHKTGKVRALLCAKCNMSIGLIGDSPTIASRAAEYLRTHTYADAEVAKPTRLVTAVGPDEIGTTDVT
jgi:hypothetical protein